MQWTRENLLPALVDRLQDDYDRIWLVIGDEGVGKSTFMLQLAWFWQEARGMDPTPETVLDTIAWGPADYRRAIAEKPEMSFIQVQDAWKVLHKRKAMHSDNMEAEGALLDMRAQNYFMCLGYQTFDIVPSDLAERRAHNAVVIKSRGRFELHNRANIDKRVEKGEWPDPQKVDTFGSLEGTETWRVFSETDKEKKRDHIAPEKAEAQEMTVSELADQVQEDGLSAVVSNHGGHNKLYIDKDLIEIEYGISGNRAKKVAKVLKKRDLDLAETEAKAA